MFELTADIYDLVYSHKDYAAESAWVRDVVQSRVPDAHTLLDIACGTGKHLEYLRDDFACEGVDLNERFVEIAGARTGVPVHRGDMDALALGSQFDAVVCLFSSIGYSRDLPAAIAAMARHVAPGGVLIVEPWFTPDQWLPSHVQVLDHEASGTRVVRVSNSHVEGNVSVLELHHVVCVGSDIEHVAETHRLTLFTHTEYEAAFRAAGMSYELELPGPFGRGAIIGRLREPAF